MIFFLNKTVTPRTPRDFGFPPVFPKDSHRYLLVFRKYRPKCLVPDDDGLAFRHDAQHPGPLRRTRVAPLMQRRSLNRQVPRLHDALLARRQGQLDLADELDDDVQAHRPMHRARRVRRRVDIPDCRTASERHQGGQHLQRRFVRLQVRVVRQQRGWASRDVAQSHEGAA